jgi:hypothetical protein
MTATVTHQQRATVPLLPQRLRCQYRLTLETMSFSCERVLESEGD